MTTLRIRNAVKRYANGAEAEEGVIVIAGRRLAHPTSHRGPVTFGIRPERAHLAPADAGAGAGIVTDVGVVEELDAHRLVHGRIGDAEITATRPADEPMPARRMLLAAHAADTHLFDSATGGRLSQRGLGDVLSCRDGPARTPPRGGAARPSRWRRWRASCRSRGSRPCSARASRRFCPGSGGRWRPADRATNTGCRPRAGRIPASAPISSHTTTRPARRSKARRAGGHVAMLDGRPHGPSLQRGSLLSAGSRESWDMLADLVGFLAACRSDGKKDAAAGMRPKEGLTRSDDGRSSRGVSVVSP